jgi:ubiquinone/menaquinone biosynthesis C-methylase UbiE
VDSPRATNFDLVARPYRWLEYLTFGPILEHCRYHYLTQLSTYHRALILGDGDGRFTTRLLTANPQITIDAVDSSAAMLDLLTQRARQLGPSATQRLTTIHSDALAFRLEGAPYDLVVTHFFLDCLTDDNLNALVAKIHLHLTPNATWLISEFAIPPAQPANIIARTVIAGLYRAFNVLAGLKTQRLPDYASTFRQNGFSRTDQKVFLGGLLTAELWRQPR